MSEETQNTQEELKQEVDTEKTDTISSSFSGNKNNGEEMKQIEELKNQMLLMKKQLEEQKKKQETRGFGSVDYPVEQDPNIKIVEKMKSVMDFTQHQNLSPKDRYRIYGKCYANLFFNLNNKRSV